MKRQDALYAASCIGTIAFCVGFALPHFTGQAVFWYLPLERAWELVEEPAGLGVDFYGRFFQGVIATAIAIALTLVVTSRMKTERLPKTVASLLVAWAIALVVLTMMYYVWTLAFRVPIAVPIPDWYVPR
ncbi:MAG: hypothetical protein ACKV2T_03625 [Kofleriaceae bacterium]